MNRKNSKTYTAAAYIILHLTLLPASGSAGAKHFIFHYTPDIAATNWVTQEKQRLQTIKSLGYHTACWQIHTGSGPIYKSSVLGADAGQTVPTSDITSMIAYARDVLGLEILLEIKTFGKAQMTFGKEFIKNNPNVIVEGKTKNVAWNPTFIMPDGKTIYQGLIFPLFNEIVALYGTRTPRYIIVGFDEIDKESLRTAGAKVGLTAGQLLARELNTVCSFFIDKGITPVMWVDMLTSTKLTEKDYVEGFPGDKRFEFVREANGDGEHFGGGSVMDAIPLIKNRDKIIAADWRYFGETPNGEYPTYDFFRWMGFMDVWVATWYAEQNIREFAAYSSAKGCTTFIASTWHTAQITQLRDIFTQTLHNSIAYFKDPLLASIRKPILTLGAARNAEPFFVPGQAVPLHATSPEQCPNGKGMFFIKKHNESLWPLSLICSSSVSGEKTVFDVRYTIPETAARGDIYDIKFEFYDQHQRIVQAIEHGMFVVK